MPTYQELEQYEIVWSANCLLELYICFDRVYAIQSYPSLRLVLSFRLLSGAEFDMSTSNRTIRALGFLTTAHGRHGQD